MRSRADGARIGLGHHPEQPGPGANKASAMARLAASDSAALRLSDTNRGRKASV